MCRPASADQIREILGKMPESTLAAVIAMGATVGEISEARAWLTTDDAAAKDFEHRCQGRVAEIADLLTPDDVDDEDFG